MTTPEHGDADGQYSYASAGSQLQLQVYVNHQPEELSQAIIRSIPSLGSSGPTLRWVSPLESSGLAEPQDDKFLAALGLQESCEQLRKFWPKGGPVWDALAVVNASNSQEPNGVLLVEAKSYPAEILGSGCKAAGDSRARIKESLRAAKKWLGVPEDADWMGQYYQSANRIAHLYFLRELLGVQAWLANIHFTGDPHKPTSLEQWTTSLDEMKTGMGLSDIPLPFVGTVFLQARNSAESG